MKLILGSSSPFRKKILQDAGIPFEAVSPDIDEKKIRAEDPLHTPLILSYAKAKAVAAQMSEPAIVIACDQVIVCNGQLLEKPESAEQVREWYKMYPNHPVHFVNGFTVLNTETGACLTAQEISISIFKAIPDEFTEAQIEKGTIFQCCGAIGSETEQAYGTIVQGSMESMIGLPLDFILSLIEKVK